MYTFLFSITQSILGLFGSASGGIMTFISSHGYLAVFVLMLLEGSSVPVPSEIVLPAAGLLASQGVINLYLAILVGLLGNTIGLVIDYYIGYFIGKEIVYKHLEWFHMKRSRLDAFDRWFAANGAAAVFFTRMIPLIRTLISFPAGFAKMPKLKFFGYSIAGSLVWDSVLVLFGYYLFSYVHSVPLILGAIGAFAIVLYAIYHLFIKRMVRRRR
ncbi:MAG: DedA family protein [Candidatus Micrarchaeota archaeon]|nr:DedA family protein [Candidatus Micrarchaeota archaeon]